METTAATVTSTAIGFPPTTIAVFVSLVIIALAIDLLTHNKDKPVTLANASMWSIFWVAISLAFAGYLYVAHGAEVASLYVTGYALEPPTEPALFTELGLEDRIDHHIGDVRDLAGLREVMAAAQPEVVEAVAEVADAAHFLLENWLTTSAAWETISRIIVISSLVKGG